MTAPLPDGLVAVVKRDCPTCATVEPVLGQLARALGERLTVYSQDDPAFPAGVPGVVDDRDLDVSWHLDLTTVPTLLQVEGGVEKERIVGWERAQWEAFTGVSGLGPGLPDYRPGCGSKHLDPEVAAALAVRFRGDDAAIPPGAPRCAGGRAGSHVGSGLDRRPARRAAHRSAGAGHAGRHRSSARSRSWRWYLPTWPRPRWKKWRSMRSWPAAAPSTSRWCSPRSRRSAPTNSTCTVCWPPPGSSVPVVVVNGPMSRAIGMNSGINALGQGNRANATIGRALQLVIRNVGGGRPGEVDRATLGTPGKYSFCFAEDEARFAMGVTGGRAGLRPRRLGGDRLCRRWRARSVAISNPGRLNPWLVRWPSVCAASAIPNWCSAHDAFLVVSPDHGRVFRQAGWSRARLRQELAGLLTLPADELIRGVGGIEEGVPPEPGRPAPPEVPRRRAAARLCRGRGRPVLGDYRRLGRWDPG